MRVILLAAVLVLAACKPIFLNPVTLETIPDVEGLSGALPAVDWTVAMKEPGAEKTGSVTLPAGSADVYVSIAPSDVPTEQLLTEYEQALIAHQLASKVSIATAAPLCHGRIEFEEISYEFHGHQFWATISMKVDAGDEQIFRGQKRFWSSEKMSMRERMGTTPQKGKQALSALVLDYFVEQLDKLPAYHDKCAAQPLFLNENPAKRSRAPAAAN